MKVVAGPARQDTSAIRTKSDKFQAILFDHEDRAFGTRDDDAVLGMNRRGGEFLSEIESEESVVARADEDAVVGNGTRGVTIGSPADFCRCERGEELVAL